MLALPLVKTRWGVPQRDISNVPTSVASSGKLNRLGLLPKQKTQKLGKRLEYDNSHRLGLHKTPKTNKKNTKKIIKDLNRTIRPGLRQKTK